MLARIATTLVLSSSHPIVADGCELGLETSRGEWGEAEMPRIHAVTPSRNIRARPKISPPPPLALEPSSMWRRSSSYIVAKELRPSGVRASVVRGRSFFFLPRQGPFDTSTMHLEAKVFGNSVHQLS